MVCVEFWKNAASVKKRETEYLKVCYEAYLVIQNKTFTLLMAWKTFPLSSFHISKTKECSRAMQANNAESLQGTRFYRRENLGLDFCYPDTNSLYRNPWFTGQCP